ncbi:hypothetical protein D3OALGA1CA_607 [Olavius algarvensis associated proteobacterium Delta 3]|nr:hypothetical protein D3OALGA1CA_607 [Olavius algarvensis associated proteobacterium Delta 3]CAB5103467.1 hypothetical protein D3OALGB2SA_1978 [Olavius algarvensis associated proteobacterium Delta 3]
MDFGESQHNRRFQWVGSFLADNHNELNMSNYRAGISSYCGF